MLIRLRFMMLMLFMLLLCDMWLRLLPASRVRCAVVDICFAAVILLFRLRLFGYVEYVGDVQFPAFASAMCNEVVTSAENGSCQYGHVESSQRALHRSLPRPPSSPTTTTPLPPCPYCLCFVYARLHAEWRMCSRPMVDSGATLVEVADHFYEWSWQR